MVRLIEKYRHLVETMHRKLEGTLQLVLIEGVSVNGTKDKLFQILARQQLQFKLMLFKMFQAFA